MSPKLKKECAEWNRRRTERPWCHRNFQWPNLWGGHDLAKRLKTANRRNRRNTLARRITNAIGEKGEGNLKRRVAESKRRPDPDCRSEREEKQKGARSENGESPITSATPTYFAEWGFDPKIWKSINSSKNTFWRVLEFWKFYNIFEGFETPILLKTLDLHSKLVLL